MRRALTGEQDLEVCDLYEGGMTIAALAADFGVSTTPIKRALKEWGVERRKRAEWRGGPPPSPVRADVVRLRAAGLTYAEIAAWLGITRNTVAGQIHRHGARK